MAQCQILPSRKLPCLSSLPSINMPVQPTRNSLAAIALWHFCGSTFFQNAHLASVSAEMQEKGVILCHSLPAETVELEDVKFHQCVRLARFENDRTISFIPPDGAFDLMSYRLSQVCVCVRVCARMDACVLTGWVRSLEVSGGVWEKWERSCAKNVEIMPPPPADASATNLRALASHLMHTPCAVQGAQLCQQCGDHASSAC
eukprot:1146063-Pelagomonas_calceolata.AAC.1